jgi:hypothetical protein
MKTFFKSFGILAIIGIAMLSCSEDIWVHDGADGQDGKDGIDGSDGYSSLVCFDEVTQTTIFYLDRDRNLELTPPDSILHQITKEGYKFVPVEDCIEIYKIMGSAEIFVGSICDGEDGSDGNDGETGPQGPQGEAGIVVFSVVPDTVNCKSGLRVIMTSLQGGEEISSVSFCIPADGEDGLTVVQTDTIVIIDSTFVFYTDTIVRIDSIFVIGEDTTVKGYEVIPLPDIFDAFNNGDSYFYWNLDYLFKKGVISINNNDSPNGNGTVESTKPYGQNWGEFYTPEFPPSAITAVELDVGSRSTWKVELLFIRANGSATIVHSQVMEGKDDVVWYETGTYGEPFTYYIPLDKIKYNDVIRVEFRIHKYGPWEELNRNYTFNGDNLRISRVKVKIVE